MITNVSIELTDEERGRLNAARGKFGLISRDEVRELVLAFVRESVASAPAPKRRGKKQPALGLEHDGTPDQAATDRAFAGDDAVCKCGAPKSEHKTTRFYCPLTKSTKPGSRFEAAQ